MQVVVIRLIIGSIAGPMSPVLPGAAGLSGDGWLPLRLRKSCHLHHRRIRQAYLLAQRATRPVKPDGQVVGRDAERPGGFGSRTVLQVQLKDEVGIFSLQSRKKLGNEPARFERALAGSIGIFGLVVKPNVKRHFARLSTSVRPAMIHERRFEYPAQPPANRQGITQLIGALQRFQRKGLGHLLRAAPVSEAADGDTAIEGQAFHHRLFDNLPRSLGTIVAGDARFTLEIVDVPASLCQTSPPGDWLRGANGPT